MGKKEVTRVVIGDDEYKNKFKKFIKDLGTVPELDDNFCIIGSTPIPDEYDPNKCFDAVKSGGINKIKNKSGGTTGRKRGRPPNPREGEEEEDNDEEDNNENFMIDESYF